MKNKLINTANFKKIKKKIKKKKIILCHGVFDLLHAGHLDYFESAKKFGDILVVSVTSDRFVNKGFNRPIFDLENRKKILSELSIVDFVCESDSHDAISIIEKIKPNIYCTYWNFINFKLQSGI